MDRPQRLAALPLVFAVSACTMIGSPELGGPPPRPIPPPISSGSVGDPSGVEPPSRSGNMAEYQQSGVTYRVLDSSYGYDEEGLASWYGQAFHGRRTSSGETYDMNRLSAAHRTLPLPSWVEVTNLANGRSVVVRVNDRGPFRDTDQRIIDLSYAAAVQLDMVGDGTAPVRVRAVEPWQVRVER